MAPGVAEGLADETEMKFVPLLRDLCSVTLARDGGALAVRLAVPALEPPLPARVASAAAFLAFIFSMRASCLSLLELIAFAWLV